MKMGKYTLDLETSGKIKVGQAVYSLPDGKFYVVDKEKIRGLPLGYISQITKNGIRINIQGGEYLLSGGDTSALIEPPKIKSRFQILKEDN